MSSRAMRKVLKDQPISLATEDRTDESEEEYALSGPMNAFSMLQVDDDVDEQADESEHEDKPNLSKSKPKANKKKSKKKKNKKKEVAEHEESEFPDEYLESKGFDNHTKEYGEERDVNEEELLKVEAVYMNAEAELKKLFGSAAIKNDASVRKSSRFPGKFLLATPNDYWPNITRLGLSMERINKDDEEKEMIFSFRHSDDYQKLHERFLSLVSSMIPELLTEFAQTYPGHVGCMVLLSFMSIQTGDFTMASEYLSRAFFTFEKSFDLKFSLLTIANRECRLPYYNYENRCFYLAMFNHLCLLQRKGCWRTAFECAKATLKLSPVDDPLAVWLLIDFLALRANNPQFVVNSLKLFEALNNYPTWKYSYALAVYQMESKGAEDYCPSSLDKHRESVVLLKEAATEYPEILQTLINDEFPNSKLSVYASDVENLRADNENQVMKMFCELYSFRMKSLFRQTHVMEWIKLFIREEFDLEVAAENDSFLLNYSNVQLNTCRHLYLTEWTNSSISTGSPLSLSKFIPTDLMVSETLWGSPQNSIVDPFPPVFDENFGSSPIDPYKKYYVRELILKYPHDLIPSIVSAKDITTQELVKYYGINASELPQEYQQHLQSPDANHNSGESFVGIVQRMLTSFFSTQPRTNISSDDNGLLIKFICNQ